MGLVNTTTNLSYARNELIKVGTSFVFDKVADMIYYMLANDDVSSTSTVAEAIGSFNGATAGSGVALTSSTTGAFKVFADDNDTDIGSGTLARAIWGRNLVTAGSQNAELAGVQGSVVVSTGEIIHNAGAVWGSLEARGTSSLNGTAGQNIFAAVMGRVGVGSGVALDIKTGAVCAGVAAVSNINTGSTTTQTGVTSGFYVGQWPTTDNWDYGLYIADAVGVAIFIADTNKIEFYDTGIYIQASADNKLKLSADGTGDDDITLSGTVVLDDNLFLASGKKIDFNSGDVTITHSTDALTLASTWTADAVGRPWGVNLTLSVVGGNYVNAIKGYVDCTTSDGGTIGLLSAVNCEIAMPDQCRGAYYPLEIEWVGKTSTSFGDPGTGSQSGFMSINCSGFRDYIDSAGVFFTLNGLTAETDGMLSANSQTLRVDIAQGTARYLVMSRIQNGIGLGNATDDTIEYTEGAPVFRLYAECDNTSATTAEPFYVYSKVDGVGGYGGRSRFHTYTNVASGTNVMALKAHMEYGIAGSTSGFSTAFCPELVMPNASVNGSYYVIECEYVAGGNSTTLQGSIGNSDSGFIFMNNSGDPNGDFDDNGFLFRIAGLNDATTHLLYENTLRLAVGTTTWYLPLSTTEASYTTAFPILSTYAGEALSIDSTLTGSDHIKLVDINVTDATTENSGWNAVFFLEDTCTGVKTSTEYSAARFNLLLNTGEQTGIMNALKAKVGTGDVPTLTSGNVNGIMVSMDEIGQCSSLNCMWLEMYTTTTGSTSYISMRSQATAQVENLFRHYGNNKPTYFFKDQTGNATGFWDLIASTDADVLGHIKILMGGTTGYINVYVSTS